MLDSYVMTSDTCFAPAIDKDGKYLTLCTCAVRTRKAAHKGDWILGTVGKSLNRPNFRNIVYLARVTDVLEPNGFKKYWRDKRFLGRDDRVYQPVLDHYKSVPRNPHDTLIEQKHDLSVNRVLISDHFYYFGGHPQPTPALGKNLVSPRFSKFTDDEARKFISWAKENWQRFRNKWAPPTEPKGLLIHVGDDNEPGTINENESKYSVELLDEHHDPDLKHYTFGDWTSKTSEFDRIRSGDYLFFNFKLYNPVRGSQ